MKLQVLKSNLLVANITIGVDEYVPLSVVIDYERLYSQDCQYLSFRSKGTFSELLIGIDYGELLKITILKFGQNLLAHDTIDQGQLIAIDEAAALAPPTNCHDRYCVTPHSLHATIQQKTLMALQNDINVPRFSFQFNDQFALLVDQEFAFAGFTISNLQEEELNLLGKALRAHV